MYTSAVNLYEWEGTAGKPAVKGDNGAVITLENLADFDMRQTDSAIAYIKQHAKESKPFFMDVQTMLRLAPSCDDQSLRSVSAGSNVMAQTLHLRAYGRESPKRRARNDIQSARFLVSPDVRCGSRLCEKSVVQFACRISVSISSMRKRLASVLLSQGAY
jgi:hypothetical protein